MTFVLGLKIRRDLRQELREDISGKGNFVTKIKNTKDVWGAKADQIGQNSGFLWRVVEKEAEENSVGTEYGEFDCQMC